MTKKHRVNRKRHRSPWSKLFAKTETRLSARVTREEDWQTDVPNIRLSRAFVIVLLMHVVVGGALIAFTLMNPSEASEQAKVSGKQKKAEKLADATEKPGTAATTEGAGSGTVAANDRTDDMRRHIVHSGDSVAKIAEEYGVTSEEIHAVNLIDEVYQLYQGRVLRIPVSASSPVPLERAIAERPSTNGHNVVTTVPGRIPGTVPRAEVADPQEIRSAALEPNPLEGSLLPESIAGISRPIVEEDTEPEYEPERTEQPEIAEEPAPARERERETPIVRPREVPVQPVAPPVQPSSSKTYQVVKGDNAFRIGQKFGIHYQELLRFNGITDPSKLQIGQTLRIPSNESR